MRTKNFLVWLLGLSALACQFTTVMALREYCRFYEVPDGFAALSAVVLVYLSVLVLVWAEQFPHRWPRYIPLYMVFALLGLFVPAATFEMQLTFAVVGLMPLVLMGCMWWIKRYWTIRVC